MPDGDERTSGGNHDLRDRCVNHLFEQQAIKTPDAVAVTVYRGGASPPVAPVGPTARRQPYLTYEQLNRTANRLAHRLRSLGVGPDDVVGVCVRRSLRMTAAVLGVLKAGAAYLPLDLTHPRRRIEEMLQDARVPVMVTDLKARSNRLPQATTVIHLDDDHCVAATPCDGNPQIALAPHHLAYVLYTSGSTGRSKGVAMPHGPLVNLIAWQLGFWQDRRAARTLQFAPLSFDVSFQEMFCTWCAGGTLILVGKRVRRDPRRLLRCLRRCEVERAFLPVVALRYLADAAQSESQAPASLRQIITAGEQLEISPPVADLLGRLPQCVLYNQYGPTETHVVTQYAVPRGAEAPPRLPPIGRAIANVRIYLLDSRGQPVPDGESGEIYVGGAAVAREYLGQPKLTDERFVADPFAPGEGRRMYRTGDFARRLSGGDLQFLGRRDDQVKIRGHRVELGEVQSALEEASSVRQAVVLAQRTAPGTRRLMAYVEKQPGQIADAGQLRQQLRERLPDYMIPARILVLDHLPISPNGKIDRVTLATAGDSSSGEGTEPGVTCLAPRDRWELQLARIWEELLDRRPIGVTEDFFQLGGDSLLAMDLVFRIERSFGRQLSVATLLRSATIGQLAEQLRRGVGSQPWSPLVPFQAQGTRRPLFCVHPGGGNVLCYLPLASHLSAEQPVYGLEAAGLDGTRPPSRRVEVMATRYIQAMREVQPQGPYAVGGWSFGGIVAYEMAGQLLDQGDEISLLAIMDAGILYSLIIMHTIFPREELGLAELQRLPPAEQVDEFRRRTASAQLVPPQASQALAERIYQIFVANAHAMMDYRPRCYPGKLTLFLGREKLAKTRHDPSEEWRDLCDEVELHEVPGSHLTLIHEPHVKVLAEILRACLSE